MKALCGKLSAAVNWYMFKFVRESCTIVSLWREIGLSYRLLCGILLNHLITIGSGGRV